MNRILGPFRATALRQPPGLFYLAAILIFAFAICGGCGGSGHAMSSSPVLNVSSMASAFSAVQGSSSNPSPASIDVTNTGTGTLNFTAASDAAWLTVSPANGTAPQTLQLFAAVGTMVANTYTGHITVTAASAQGSPAVITVTFTVGSQAASNAPFWPQWGSNPQHAGMVAATGQNLTTVLANIVYDPFVDQEKNENTPVFGEAVLTVHEQSPLLDGTDAYMVTKTGTYNSCNPVGNWVNGAACGPNTWNTMVWNEVRFSWVAGQLAQAWSFSSDWVPEPNATDANDGGLGGWEPVFHPVDANNFIYVPGAAGTVWKVNKTTGVSASHPINPFTGNGTVTAANTFVAGPLTADASGNIYYNVIQVDVADPGPWDANDATGAWLVKIAPDDSAIFATFASLVPGAPPGAAQTCPGTFFSQNPRPAFPWPPSPTAVAPTLPCGSQRPGINVAPAISADGSTVYTVSRAHFDGMEAFLVAVNSADLTPKWQASLQNRLTDGCGTLLPIAASGVTNLMSSCLFGTTPGVDPTTNTQGSGSISDQASSSPTVLPDGSIVIGALDNYNFSRGHLFRFSALGSYLGAYPFGWDSTPGVYVHDGTFSILIKDNHYPSGAYCGNPNNPVCGSTSPGPYFITQLDANLNIEWQFQSTTIDTEHPNGYEWCINMPAIDMLGNVYVNSEDGNIYEISQGHTGIFTAPAGKMFLDIALGAAYTPLSIGADGKLYTQNNGKLFVAGN